MKPTELTTSVWAVDDADFPRDAAIDEQIRFLLNYAILAPSSHNSQPWRFAVRDGRVEVRPDEDRWLDVADPDKREFYISLGCAVENLCIAADHFGFDYRLDYRAEMDDGLVPVLTLNWDDETPSSRDSELFEAITDRYTSHQRFDDEPIASRIRERIRRCSDQTDVTVHLVEENEQKREIAELQASADETQMDDPQYRKELAEWVGNGALGHSWLMARVGQAAITYFDLGQREGQKNSTLVANAPILGVLATPADEPTAWIEVGRVFERIALVATVEGLAVHPMSQILERPDTRTRLTELMGLTDAVPQHLFRMGSAGEAPRHTPRWPVERVLADRS